MNGRMETAVVLILSDAKFITPKTKEGCHQAKTIDFRSPFFQTKKARNFPK